VRSIEADIKNLEQTTHALAGMSFDVVANFIAFKPDDIERDLRLFKDRCRQYIFVSSASAYQKPVRNYLITENTPLENPFWPYSQNKIAAEARLMRAYAEEGFPATIVRPSLTIGDGMLPHVLWYWNSPWTVAHRILSGKPLIVPGDGTSLWVVTHNTDFARGFVGLMNNPRAIGEAFHITTDEVTNWDTIYQTLAESLAREANLVHIASDWLIRFDPNLRGTLLGDKACSVAFDNSKLKSVVPDFRATVGLRETCDRCVRWFQLDPSRQKLDPAADAKTDDALSRYG
jgi:nucleoside-diphosphate-sugar epimerase